MKKILSWVLIFGTIIFIFFVINKFLPTADILSLVSGGALGLACLNATERLWDRYKNKDYLERTDYRIKELEIKVEDLVNRRVLK